jgi:hypothetical protein
VASIKGRYEYDDDDLTPGKKKEGGLHQNLYDSEGNLKGNARFIPDEGRDDSELEPVVVYEPVYVYDEEYERRREREREENAELIAKVVVLLVAVAAPHAKRFWLEKARPAMEARRARKVDRKANRAARKALKKAAKHPTVLEAAVVDSGHELAVAEEVYRTDMSSAEAQARYLAAFAARAFSDEQMKLVSDANIVDGEALSELHRTLAELPPQQVKGIIEAVEANPSVLTGDLMTELGNLLGLRGEADLDPIEQRSDR